MWKKDISNDALTHIDYQIDDYKALLRYVNFLANHKMGYPVSLLTYLGVINNKILGIKPNTLANILLNNVGDPYKDSETSLLEVKKHERKIISILTKFYGMAENELKGYVTTGGTEGNFASLWWSKRYLINNSLPRLIKADDEIKLKLKEEQEIFATLSKTPLNHTSFRLDQLQKILDIKTAIDANKNKVQELLTPTIFFCKDHTHYSIPKIAEILKLHIRPIVANQDGSMNLQDLRKELLLHLGAHQNSSVIVIANIGTTITGAIDNVPEIRNILNDLLPSKSFTIHMDGALTGFVLPIVKPFGEVENYFSALGVNTLAVSAHKYPGLSQPCGIILANKKFFDKAFEKSERSIEYVGNIVDVTITGSRSGLNVLMFYNALRTLALENGTQKLEKMVAENLSNANYLYHQLVDLYGAKNVYYPYHFNISFPRPSPLLAKKYQLMLTGKNATICVLTNVTRSLIDRFIKDLKVEKENVMTNTTTKIDYSVQTLQEEHVKSAMDLFIKAFCDSEPMTKHLNIRYQDYEPFAREVIQKAVKEGLSKVAVNKQNRVIAFTIAEDLADPFIPHPAHYPKLRPIFSLLNKLSFPLIKGKKFLKGKVIHIWLAAVDPTYRGQGLSTINDMSCVEGAARKGYDYAYAEFTNELSANVTHQFKILQLYNKIKYDDFQDENNQTPFKGVKGEASAYLATIRPGVRLDALSHCYAKTAAETKT